MITEIIPRLYISSANDIKEVGTEGLKGLGISAVINVAYEIDDSEYVDPLQFGLYKYPLEDRDLEQTALIKQASKKVAELMLEGKTVLVHCQAGISRSGIVIIGALKLLTHKSWPSCEKLLKEKNKPSRFFLNNQLLNRTIRNWNLYTI